MSVTVSHGNAPADCGPTESQMERRVEKMHALYRAGRSLRAVGEEFGISGERVRQLFRDNGLKTRNRRESQTLLWERYEKKPAERKSSAQRKPSEWIEKKYNDEELLHTLRETSEAIGGILTTSAYNDFAKVQRFPDGRQWPSHQTHFQRFGSWREALLTAGLAANPSSAISGQRIFGKGQCIDAVRHAQRELDEVPTLNQYEALARRSNGALPSAATIRNRCGSWSKAVELARVD